jgi:PAS domain S-box-containing protein
MSNAGLVLSMDSMMRDLSRLQFLLTIVEADMAVFADDRGRILYMSKGCEQLFGWKVHELVGKPLTILMPNRYHKAHQKGLDRVVKQGGVESSQMLYHTIRLAALTKARREVPVDVSVAAWRAAEGAFYFAARFEVLEGES